MNSYLKTVLIAVLSGMAVGLMFSLMLGLGMYGDFAPAGSDYLLNPNPIIGWGYCGLLIGLFMCIISYFGSPKQKVKNARPRNLFLRWVAHETRRGILIATLFYILLAVPSLIDLLINLRLVHDSLWNLTSFMSMLIFTALSIGVLIGLFLMVVQLPRFLWRWVTHLEQKRKPLYGASYE